MLSVRLGRSLVGGLPRRLPRGGGGGVGPYAGPRGGGGGVGLPGGFGSAGGAARRTFISLPEFEPQRHWLLWGIIGANIAVFAAHEWGDRRTKQAILRHGVLSWRRFEQRPYVLATSAFTHLSVGHLAANLFTLWSFGSSAIDILGTRRFALLYGAGMLASGAAHLAYCSYMPWTHFPAAWGVQRESPAVGASGAIAACVGCLTTLNPRGQLYLLIIPVPNLLAIGGFMVYSGYAALYGSGNDWAHAAHLGGALTGVAAGLVLRRRFRFY